MVRRVFLLAVSVILAVVVERPDCWAKVINVPGDQPTIQAGINAASNADTILVARPPEGRAVRGGFWRQLHQFVEHPRPIPGIATVRNR
jgi:hypothetical protein